MFLKSNLLTMLMSCMALNAALSMEEDPRSWPFLEEGDKIRVVAPGFGSKESLENVEENIKKLGFTPIVPSSLISTQRLGFSNTLSYRVEDFKDAFNSDAKVIWALRGGRDNSKVIRKLEALEKLEGNWAPEGTPKLFVGFSDNTATHLRLNVVHDMPSLHGVVLAYNANANQAVNSETALEDYKPILTGKQKKVRYTFKQLNRVGIEGKIRGSIIGGNISLVQRSIGTKTQPQTESRFLFLEDDGELPSRLDEILTHLEGAGIFDRPKAVLLGKFSFLKYGEETEEDLSYVLTSFAENLEERKIPVFQSDNHGHGPRNFPLPLNTEASIKQIDNDEGEIIIKTNKFPRKEK